MTQAGSLTRAAGLVLGALIIEGTRRRSGGRDASKGAEQGDKARCSSRPLHGGAVPRRLGSGCGN